MDFNNSESPKGSRYLDPDSSNPYAASEATSEPSLKPLGSLAQSARLKQLNSARAILVTVGVLTLAANAFMFSNAEREIDDAINQGMQPGMVVDQEKRAEIINMVRMIYGGTCVLGAVFIVLGILVKKFPVPTTVLGLVLYLGGNAVFALLSPESFTRGIVLIVKIVIAIALVKAMQAAFAYQKELNEARLAGELA